MSESENKFTEEDIDNDGRIKRECGVKLRDIAKTQAPELYKHFAKVCEEKGIRPEDRFGHMVILALEDEGFAEELFYQEVDLSTIKGDDMTMKDVEFVLDVFDKLDLNEDRGKDPIDKIIEKRLESVGGSPLDGLSDSVEEATQRGKTEGELKEIKSQLDELSKKVIDSEDGGESDADTTTDDGSGMRDLDDVFGGGEGEQQDGTESPEEDGDSGDRDDDYYEEQDERDVSVTVATGDKSGDGNEVMTTREVQDE